MTTTIQYKTLSIAQNTIPNKTAIKKTESIYTPNLFDEHVTNIVKPTVSLSDIAQTIYEKEISSASKTTNPLYSYVWFLN